MTGKGNAEAGFGSFGNLIFIGNPRGRGEHDLKSRLRVDPHIGGLDAGFAMDNHGVREQAVMVAIRRGDFADSISGVIVAGAGSVFGPGLAKRLI
jgi:hypothetical protein